MADDFNFFINCYYAFWCNCCNRTKKFKRLIAYSSISHIGYALAGLATGSNEGIQSSVIYLTIYIIMNLGFFSCLLMMKRNNIYYENLDDLSGLSKNHPLLSLSLLVILFSLAGIPPLAGFFAKFYDIQICNRTIDVFLSYSWIIINCGCSFLLFTNYKDYVF